MSKKNNIHHHDHLLVIVLGILGVMLVAIGTRGQLLAPIVSGLGFLVVTYKWRCDECETKKKK